MVDHDSGGHQHQHGHAHGHHHGDIDDARSRRWAEDLELEGEVTLDFVTSTVDRLEALPDWTPPRRVADIGSGPGVATCEFARLLPGAEVIAFDPSEAMLERAMERVERFGLTDRVRVVQGEMPHDLTRLDQVDLVWASMSLHHVGDEVAALRALHDIVTTGGLIVIAEMADPMRMLPADLGRGRPGLVDRLEHCWTTWFRDMRHGLDASVESEDVAAMITAAGFSVVDDRVARIRLQPPLTSELRAFVAQTLTRARSQLASMLDADDVEVIDELLDPGSALSIARRDDVFVEASRRIVIARVG